MITARHSAHIEVRDGSKEDRAEMVRKLHMETFAKAVAIGPNGEVENQTNADLPAIMATKPEWITI